MDRGRGIHYPSTTNMSYKERMKHKFHSLDPMIIRGTVGFGYGFMFGSTIGLLGGMQHLGDEELRVGRRIVKMTKAGLGVGVFCGILVTVGFTVLKR